jgi:hypothetical protein
MEEGAAAEGDDYICKVQFDLGPIYDAKPPPTVELPLFDAIRSRSLRRLLEIRLLTSSQRMD